MADKGTLEDRVKALERYMVTVAKAISDVKAGLKVLVEKGNNKKNEELKEILDSQKIIDEIIVSNTDAIKRFDKEIKLIESDKPKMVIVDRDTKEETMEDKAKFADIKCRYFDEGFCKYRSKCRYFHPKDICEAHKKNENCIKKNCKDRHPEKCKFWQSSNGCKRQNWTLFDNY